MREFWANVWANGDGFDDLGYERPSREDCDQYLAARPNYRVHVRLKPKGAPRRYASEANRRAWESDPDTCRMMVRHGSPPEDPWDD